MLVWVVLLAHCVTKVHRIKSIIVSMRICGEWGMHGEVVQSYRIALTHIFRGEIPLASAPGREELGFRRRVGVVDDVRPVHGIDRCLPIIQSQREVLVQQIGTVDRVGKRRGERRCSWLV